MSYLDLDFKSRPATPIHRPLRRPSPKLHLNRIIRGLTALVTLIGAVYLILWLLPDGTPKTADSTAELERLHYSVLLPSRIESEDPDIPVPELEPVIEDKRWKTSKIKSGDTLASIFSKAGLSASTTYEVVNLNKQTKKLSKIRPGQSISLLVIEDNQLV